MAAPAVCPICGRQQVTFWYHGRRIFTHHTAEKHARVGNDQDRYPMPCEASGWIVEDEDQVA